MNVKGKLTIDGNVKVTMNPDYVPKAGDEFCLWKTNDFSGTPVIELPELPEGLEWDFTGLTDASGMLKVKTSSGVTAIQDSETVNCKVYDAFGILVGEFEATKATARSEAQRILNLNHGIYLLLMETSNRAETLKLHF